MAGRYLSLAAVLVSLVFAQQLQSSAGDGSGSGSGDPMPPMSLTPCLDAGRTSCCVGRDDGCLDDSGTCYCDEFCKLAGSGDCCEDLMNGMLPCGPVDLSCANSLEDRVAGLAEIQTVIAETYVGQPDHFPTVAMYQRELERQTERLLFEHFDLDSNGELNDHEFHLLYIAIASETQDKFLDLCEADFKGFCVGNANGTVSLSGLMLCTGATQYCIFEGETSLLLAKNLLVSRLQPIFQNSFLRVQFSISLFPVADKDNPKGLLSLDEFSVLYSRIIELYNVFPSVCHEVAFELCNTNNDQFVSLQEVVACGTGDD